jgi:hypothetical protein
MYDRSHDRERQIERILELTRAARERAEQRDWPSAVACERQRRPLISEYFASPLPVKGRVRVAEAIREILASDAGLIALAAKGRNEAAEESNRLRRGRKATAAYLAAGSYSARRLPAGGNGLPPAQPPMREVIDLP